MIRAWRYTITRPKALFLTSQFGLLAAVVSIAALIQGISPSLFLRDHAGLILLLLFPQICSHLNRLDTLVAAPNSRLFITKTLSSMVLGLLLTIPFFLLFPNLFPGYLGALAAVAVSAMMPFALRAMLQQMIRRRWGVEGLLIIGTGDMARKVYTELAQGSEALQNGTGWGVSVDGNHIDCPQPFEESGEVIRDFNQLRQIMVRDGINRIVVAEPHIPSSEELAIALLDCKLQGFEVEQAIQSYERLNNKIWLEALRPEWLVYSNGFRPPKHYFAVKRFFDFVAAVALLAVAAVPAGVVALLIKLESRGPVLFRQVRVGLHGKDFILFKFRTMRNDAESATGPVWAAEKDNRVTSLGKYLRKFRLDEIPQLLNVVRGEMSLVGPRPERPHFVDLLNKHIQYYGLRHSVMPGITGWAQVLYPYGASVKDAYEKLQYDLYYAKHMSLGMDLRILLRTVRVVVFGRGR